MILKSYYALWCHKLCNLHIEWTQLALILKTWQCHAIYAKNLQFSRTWFYLFDNKKIQNGNTIVSYPIPYFRTKFLYLLLTYCMLTTILFQFCAKFTSAGIAQNGLILPLTPFLWMSHVWSCTIAKLYEHNELRLYVNKHPHTICSIRKDSDSQVNLPHQNASKSTLQRKRKKIKYS